MIETLMLQLTSKNLLSLIKIELESNTCGMLGMVLGDNSQKRKE
jgi:hypothetical protein